MARIRTIKPEFYRHELLQELEVSHPELRPMLVFSALWGHCDKQGVFPWDQKQLALDILPFVWRGGIGEAPGKCLGLLWEHNLVLQGEIDGKSYGFIPSFKNHQRINGKEKDAPAKYPDFNNLQLGKHPGSTREAPEQQPRTQEGKGRERKGGTTGKGTATSRRFAPPTPEAVSEYAKSIDFVLDGKYFCDHYIARGWKLKNTPMKDWKAAVRTWKRNEKKQPKPDHVPGELTDWEKALEKKDGNRSQGLHEDVRSD